MRSQTNTCTCQWVTIFCECNSRAFSRTSFALLPEEPSMSDFAGRFSPCGLLFIGSGFGKGEQQIPDHYFLLWLLILILATGFSPYPSLYPSPSLFRSSFPSTST